MYNLDMIIGFWRTLALGIALTTLPTSYAQGFAPTGTNGTGPLSQFKSRPDIYAPFLNISLFDEKSVTPGYIFIAPYQTFQNAIYIYDNRGNLVYSGFGATGSGPSHNFHVCSVNGADNLCYITGAQNEGYVRGYGVIMDDSLKAWTSIRSQGGLSAFDEHEFNVVDSGKDALLTLYQPERYDLTGVGITTGQGWIMNAYFQRIEIGTNRLIFEWSALDFVSPSETWIKPNSTDVSGTGFNPTSPFDYFHINSVDLNADGDYLVSARYTSTVYKISGQDGHIIWRLGGSKSDFTFPKGVNFTFQHDARFLSENGSTTILSIFDNASDGYNQSARYSSGKIFKLDHTTNTVSILQTFIAPYQFISASQGNIQALGPKAQWNTINWFAGWGSNAYISEYTSDGTMVLRGHFATTGSMNYRAYKANFTTNPTDTPALYTYARNTSTGTIYYMSWNGATKPTQWRIYGGNSSTGPWTVVDTVPKQGFETTYTASTFYQWGLVESLDSQGNALKNSTRAIKTFVPGTDLAASCDTYQCPAVSRYQKAATTSTSSSSTATQSPTATSSNAALGIQRRSLNGGNIAFGAVVALGGLQF